MEPQFNEVPRDWGNWLVISRVSLDWVTFPYFLPLLDKTTWFDILRTSLYRGSLSRGSTVIQNNRLVVLVCSQSLFVSKGIKVHVEI